MFNKKESESELVTSLKNRISELEDLVNKLANDNGSVVVKQLPDGSIELNGEFMDNTTEVEYYNSASATYGELTMFRIGKEAKQREMNKLIETHMNEIDEYKRQISNLNTDIDTLQDAIKMHKDTIDMYEKSEKSLKDQLDKKYHQIDELIKDNKTEKQELKTRYEKTIACLEEDIALWKRRYLEKNNISITDEIITKYGTISK